MNFSIFFYKKFKYDFFFFMISFRINKGVYLCLFELATTRRYDYEHNCSSLMAFLSILSHLAHLAQFFSDLKWDRSIDVLILAHVNTRKHVSLAAHLQGL